MILLFPIQQETISFEAAAFELTNKINVNLVNFSENLLKPIPSRIFPWVHFTHKFKKNENIKIR